MSKHLAENLFHFHFSKLSTSNLTIWSDFPALKIQFKSIFFWFLSYLSEIIWWFLFFGFVHLSSAFSRLKSKSDVMGRLGWAGCSLSSPSLPQKRVIYWTWTKNTVKFWRFQLLFGYFFHRCIYVTKEVSCIAEQFEGEVTQPSLIINYCAIILSFPGHSFVTHRRGISRNGIPRYFFLKLIINYSWVIHTNNTVGKVKE